MCGRRPVEYHPVEYHRSIGESPARPLSLAPAIHAIADRASAGCPPDAQVQTHELTTREPGHADDDMPVPVDVATRLNDGDLGHRRAAPRVLDTHHNVGLEPGVVCVPPGGHLCHRALDNHVCAFHEPLGTEPLDHRRGRAAAPEGEQAGAYQRAQDHRPLAATHAATGSPVIHDIRSRRRRPEIAAPTTSANGNPAPHGMLESSPPIRQPPDDGVGSHIPRLVQRISLPQSKSTRQS